MALDNADGDTQDSTTDQNETSSQTSEDADSGLLRAPDTDDDPTTSETTTQRSDDPTTSGVVDAPDTSDDPTDNTSQDASTEPDSERQDDTGTTGGSFDSGEQQATPDSGGLATAPDDTQPETSGEQQRRQQDATPASGGTADAPGARSQTVDRQGDDRTSGPTREDYDTTSEFVEASAERAFDSVDDSEVYSARTGDRIEPRFTERGARQAAAELLGAGVTASDIEFERDPEGGFTFEDIENVAQQEQVALAGELSRYEGERRSLQRDIVSEALTEAGIEAREEAERRREQATQMLRAQARSEGVDPERLEAQTGRDIDGDGDVTTMSEYVEQQYRQQVAASTGTELDNSDVTTTRIKEDGETLVVGQLTESGEQAVESSMESASFTAKIPDAVPLVGGASQTIKGDASDVEISTSEKGELSVETQERFGDIDWTPFVEGDPVEATLRQSGESAIGYSEELADEIFSDNGVGSESLGEEVLDAAGQEALGDAYEQTLEGVGRGLVKTPAMLYSELTTKPLEAVELGAETVSSPGEVGRKLPGAIAGTGAAAGTYAAQNPGEFTGAVVGSAGVTAGAFSALQGTRAGLASRYALQPGEEVAKAAARRGLVSERTATVVPGVRGTNIDTKTTARGMMSSARETAEGRIPDVTTQDVVNRARLGYQRVRYPRPSKQEMPRIDLGDTDDVDAVYVQDMRADTETAAGSGGIETDSEGVEDSTDADTDSDSGASEGSGTTFDGPVVEVDAGGGQKTLLRLQMESERETSQDLAYEQEFDAVSETSAAFAPGLEFTIPVEEAANVETAAVGSEFDVGPSLESRVSDIELGSVESAGIESGIETGVESIAEVGFETSAEVGLETSNEVSVETGTISEVDAEGESTIESLLETELESAPERERVIPDEDTQEGDDAGMFVSQQFTEENIDTGIADVDELEDLMADIESRFE